MKALISYADESMSISLEKCYESGIENGFDMCYSVPIDREFKEFNKEIFDQPRGVGYWLWKPYIIYKSLLKLKEGDILAYSDAGVKFVGSIDPVLNAMDSDVMLFSNGWTHIEWCKMDCIQAINGLNGFSSVQTQGGYFYEIDGYDQHKQVQASNIFIKNTEFARDFVKEWLLYCQIPGLIDDSPSVIDNFPTFAEHRHDQAILTCIAIKYNIKQHWFPSTTNLHKRSDFKDIYNPILEHHRKRNTEW